MCLKDDLVLELRTISRLRRASIAPSTFRAYSEEVRSLVAYISALSLSTDTPRQVDTAVSAYGVYLYDLNPRRSNLQKFRYSLFEIIFLVPELKLLLNISRQIEKGWDKTAPSKSPPPLSVTTVNAISAWLASFGRVRASLAINLGFHAFLRANEICSMQVTDFCFPNDDRLSDFLADRSGFVVRNAKTGKNQYIPVTDATLLRGLNRFVLSKPSSASSLFHLSYSELTASFHDALVHFKITNLVYRLHSIRHGGATFEWLNNVPLQDVMMKGRWEAESS